MANAVELYPTLAQGAPCILYLSMAIADVKFCILKPYPWFHCAPKISLGLVGTRGHDALAMPATLAALSAIFQAFPVLCLCKPRLQRGEMQACPVALVPTLGCSRPLLPSLLLVASALSGNIIPGYVFLLSKNGPYIRTCIVTPQAKREHTRSITPPDDFTPASLERPPARW